jgi:N-acetylglucosaminyl-diphospho-decaprenol L-rhamnosyltransferase
MPKNVGFGAGCNAGFDAVRPRAVFFVNPDAELPVGATRQLLDELRSPGVAAVGPSVVDPSAGAEAAGNEPTVRSAWGHFLYLSRLPLIGSLFPPLQIPRRPAAGALDVDWVGGAALVVDGTAFGSVGGFDERYFMYMEDVDLCRRLRDAGFRVRLVPTVKVRHRMGGSQGADQAARWYAAFDDYLRRRHGRTAAAAASLAASSGMAARALAYALRGGRRAEATRMFRGAAAAGRRIFG